MLADCTRDVLSTEITEVNMLAESASNSVVCPSFGVPLATPWARRIPLLSPADMLAIEIIYELGLIRVLLEQILELLIYKISATSSTVGLLSVDAQDLFSVKCWAALPTKVAIANFSDVCTAAVTKEGRATCACHLIAALCAADGHIAFRAWHRLLSDHTKRFKLIQQFLTL